MRAAPLVDLIGSPSKEITEEHVHLLLAEIEKRNEQRFGAQKEAILIDGQKVAEATYEKISVNPTLVPGHYTFPTR